jgi:hypothetical protein
MSMERMLEVISYPRRRFLGSAAATIGAAQFGILGPAEAQSTKQDSLHVPSAKRATSAPFGPFKQIDAGLLNIGFVEAGPATGPARNPSARLALRHSQVCRCCALAGSGWLPGNSPVSARLWLDALPFQ